MKGLELLASELSRYPFGHVSHSVGCLELITKEVALGDYDLVRGCSFNMLGKPDAHWMQQADTSKWNTSPEEIKKFADNVTEEVRKLYWKKGFFWGIAPKEKIIL